MANVLALDIGGRRIGVAKGDTILRIAHPYRTVLVVDGSELSELQAIVKEVEPETIVVGFPRNQSGEQTAQTETVQAFAEQLKQFGVDTVFQDESLTSVIAEQRLREAGKPYTKEMIDAEAAAIILQDYLESHYGH